MKSYKVILISLLLLSLISCKKKYDKTILGPELITDAQLVGPFVLSSTQPDFATSNNRVGFQGKFSSKVKWKISIVGNESFAEKHFTGISDTIPSGILWDGSQDSLYYFYPNETCTVTLSVDNSYNSNYISDNLNVRGNIPVNDVVLAKETLKIIKTKKTSSKQLEFFPAFFANSDLPTELDFERYFSDGFVGYDQEAGLMADKDADIPLLSGPGQKIVTKFMFKDPSYVPLSKTGGGVRNKTYYMLKGSDRTSSLFDGVPDYYIGRMASTFIATKEPNGNEATNFFFNGFNVRDSLKKKNAQDVYLNVFIYGNGDGSTVNYTLKEDKGGPDGRGVLDDRHDDELDESYEMPIKINFMGWKLFSFKYSEFTSTPFKSKRDIDIYQGKEIKKGELRKGDYADGVHSPDKLLQIQFGLVAPATAKGPGGSGRAIIDNPVISWDGPLKY